MIYLVPRFTTNVTFSNHFSATNTPTPPVPKLFSFQKNLKYKFLLAIFRDDSPLHLDSCIQQMFMWQDFINFLTSIPHGVSIIATAWITLFTFLSADLSPWPHAVVATIFKYFKNNSEHIWLNQTFYSRIPLSHFTPDQHYSDTVSFYQRDLPNWLQKTQILVPGNPEIKFRIR